MSIIIFIFIFLSLTIPERGYPWGSFYMEALAVIAGIVLCFSRKNINLIFNSFQKVIFLLILISILSVLFINEYRNTQLVSLVILYLGTFSLIFNIFYQEKNNYMFDRVLAAVLCASLINVGIQLLQIFSLENIFFNSLPLIGSRPFGNIGQPNNLGSLLTIALFVNFYFLKIKKISKLTGLIAGCFLTFGIALTDSRTAIVSVLCGFFYLISTKENRKFTSIYFTFFIFSYFFAKYVLHQFTEQRLIITNNFTSGRIDLWILFADAISKRPLLGYGFNNASTAHFEAIANHPSWWHKYVQQTHNIFLDFIVWFGVPVGLLFSFAFLYFFIKKLHQSLYDQNIQIPFLLCIPILIHSLFEYPLHYFYFILLLGVFTGKLFSIESNFSFEMKNGNLFILALIIPIAMITGIEYLRSQEIIKFQQRAMLSSGFIPDEKMLDNFLLDELAEHIYLLKRESDYKEKDYDLLKKLIKIYPIEISFDKLIIHAASEDEKSYWEIKKHQMTSKDNY